MWLLVRLYELRVSVCIFSPPCLVPLIESSGRPTDSVFLPDLKGPLWLVVPLPPGTSRGPSRRSSVMVTAPPESQEDRFEDVRRVDNSQRTTKIPRGVLTQASVVESGKSKWKDTTETPRTGTLHSRIVESGGMYTNSETSQSSKWHPTHWTVFTEVKFCKS